MARAGLGPRWTCLFANDFDARKGVAYRLNWGARELHTKDIAEIKTSDLPADPAQLAWASFPCQDLSLAGAGAGLKGERSGTFYAFWALMESLIAEGRAPDIIVLENVGGALTSHGGRDFTIICDRLNAGGYSYGALIVDAALFVPQSRPRLFFVCVRKGLGAPQGLIMSRGLMAAPSIWHPANLQKAYCGLPERLKGSWIWWSPPAPPRRNSILADLIEEEPLGVRWRSEAETVQLLSLMSAVNLQKVEMAKAESRRAGHRVAGCVYKRTRVDPGGAKIQRAEVRFDDIAGCLRTPAGGSSRQSIIIVEADNVRSRLMSARETARLMGLPDDYILPGTYNEAYHLTGDGVVVPVVRHLAEHLLEPILEAILEAKTSSASPVAHLNKASKGLTPAT
ncbi:DNA (cytosine-5)-methyltransferase 1 [Methylocapsa palsarum]|uniref:DNA (cytosine-5-)-methyltransferase n=2 Tax=Methylocapsa palsarum TaxID=1612308 RepID=A0A1I3Y9P5_9HYPH|nr:DNA (cytosine-5)-methyltransferase 1 [Methylocapsa palsarum]